MLRTACENRMVYDRLEALLSLPDAKRRAELDVLITDLLVAGAPRELVAALACLSDDKVAEKAYEVIAKCQRR